MQEIREKLSKMYTAVRQASLSMCEPLEPEDYQVQPVMDVSPPKWNLGHTSWFFWQFILRPRELSLAEDEKYRYYLNSYYHIAGPRGLRDMRGMVTRPTTSDIYRYRRSVDERMEKVIETTPESDLEDLSFLITVGVNHEQQHQELFYTEIKNIYHANPENMRPAYRTLPESESPQKLGRPSFIPFQGGVYEFGNVEGGWCWDNELSVHRAVLEDFSLCSLPVSNGEYMAFMEDGCYSNSLLWFADGWAEVEKQKWEAPLYWEKIGSEWWYFTHSGMRKVDPDEPVCHVSFYEACAFAVWKSQADGDYKGARLPHEREWEYAARVSGAGPSKGNYVEGGFFHPRPALNGRNGSPEQMFGDVWEWTLNHYEPYPGFREFPDNLSEYNGKFMNNQRVLRGGSCVTPASHMRISYRNFWHPATRFQFTGIRLAKDNR